MTFRPDNDIPTWRKVALSSWKRSNDPSINGWLDIDATELERYLTALRGEAHVTVTHLVGKAVALAFAESAECNAIASLGRLKRRDSVDVFFSVAGGDGKNLSGAKISGVDRLSVAEIARALRRDVGRIRTDGDTQLQKSQSRLRQVPAIALEPLLRLTGFAMFDLGLDLGPLGVPSDPFGTAIVSNIGVFGLEQGFAPLIPAGRTSAIFTIGAIREKPVAVRGELHVRPVLTVCGTFDHRVVDGFHLGRINAKIKAVLENPSEHLGTRDGAPRERAGQTTQSTGSPDRARSS